jgi:hypothetical protein
LRTERTAWEHERRVLRAEVEDWRERFEKKEKEGEVEGREYVLLFLFPSSSSRSPTPTNSLSPVVFLVPYHPR